MKKAFAFYLSAFTILVVLSLGCHVNPNMQTPGEGYLQGEWQQDSIPGQNKLVSYSLYHLRFSCDSFFVQIKSFSKVNTGSDTCMKSGRWTEYARGTYDQKKDTVHMKGQFCNADMTLKDDKGCFRSGDYEEFYKINKQTDSVVQFAPTSSTITINAHLIKRSNCQLKPL